jgi:hypothetical protein
MHCPGSFACGPIPARNTVTGGLLNSGNDSWLIFIKAQ